MSTTGPQTPARLTLQVFEMLVTKATPERLAKLPVSSFPLEVPDELVDSLPYEKQTIVKKALFELNMAQINDRLQVESHCGEEASKALNFCSDFSPTTITIFKNQLSEFVTDFNKLNMSSEARGTAEFSALMGKVKYLNDLSDLMKKDAVKAVGAISALQNEPSDDPLLVKVFSQEIKKLQNITQKIESYLSEYFVQRVVVVSLNMKKLMAKIKESELEINEINESVNNANIQLKTLYKSKGIFVKTRSNAGHEAKTDELVKKINMLLDRKRFIEIPISEVDLISWLDSFVDASINSDNIDKEDVKTKYKSIRMMLFQLLQKYCIQLENSARDVAQNPFSQNDPEMTIKFLLKSEEFILHYFKKKKVETMSWLGQMAESKVDLIDKLEKDLLKELKNNKFLNQ